MFLMAAVAPTGKHHRLSLGHPLGSAARADSALEVPNPAAAVEQLKGPFHGITQQHNQAHVGKRLILRAGDGSVIGRDFTFALIRQDAVAGRHTRRRQAIVQ